MEELRFGETDKRVELKIWGEFFLNPEYDIGELLFEELEFVELETLDCLRLSLWYLGDEFDELRDSLESLRWA